MVFCHEWAQIGNGTVCGVELSADLKKAVGEPFLMFDAKSGPWVGNIFDKEAYVTDGPFMIKREDKLMCLWSSFGKCGFDGGYAVGKVISESGKIVEIQGTAEGEPFEEDEFRELMCMGKEGIKQIIEKQKDALKC